MAVGLALAANTQISSLSSICAIRLLSSPTLSLLIEKNAERLSVAYRTLTDFFKKHDIAYYPANAGLCVFARLIDAKTWEEEQEIVGKVKAAGVLVSAGKAYHGPAEERGWARVLFAVEPEVLSTAIQRMESVFRKGRETIEPVSVDVPRTGE
jgi:aspartate/methionine/tyrosine aminotransferase